MTREDVLTQACDQCMKELYKYVVPHITWKQFTKECKEYSERYLEWKKNRNNHPEWKDKGIDDCIGPRPYEFHYLPKEIMKDICDSYVNAYQLDHQQNLLDIIEILKNYCKEPIVDKWIEGEGNNPGHRGYDHPDNLKKELNKILLESTTLVTDSSDNITTEIQDKFFAFLDMAGNFYNWNRDLNSFNMTVYLGASPHSNRERVIENWKKYRNKDIKIPTEKKMLKKYFEYEDEDL